MEVAISAPGRARLVCCQGSKKLGESAFNQLIRESTADAGSGLPMRSQQSSCISKIGSAIMFYTTARRLPARSWAQQLSVWGRERCASFDSWCHLDGKRTTGCRATHRTARLSAGATIFARTDPTEFWSFVMSSADE